jgi:hypothetical protein
MVRVILAAFSMTVASMAGGCQEPEYDPAPNPGLADPVPPPYNSPDITVIDGDLQQWLGFHPAVVVRSENRPMSVEVPVRNTADDQYIIQYRFTFFDEDGSVLDPVMQWDRAVLEPMAMQQLRANALDERAESWKLQVRWAR